jgi:hypothetical protein
MSVGKFLYTRGELYCCWFSGRTQPYGFLEQRYGLVVCAARLEYFPQGKRTGGNCFVVLGPNPSGALQALADQPLGLLNPGLVQPKSAERNESLRNIRAVHSVQPQAGIQ